MRGRNRFLDMLKGIAMLFIILTHYSFTDDQRLAMGFPYWVDMGVPIFMIVTGFVTAKAYERRGITSLDDAYDPMYTIRSVLRFLIPYTMIYILELIVMSRVWGWDSVPGIGYLEMYYLTGGGGPGAYYIPVMLQLVFLYPLLHRLVRVYGFGGVWLTGGLTVLYEMSRMAWQMPENTYCNLVFRYMPLVAYGIWLASDSYRPHPVIGVILLCVGALFIGGVSYGGYEPRVFNLWSGTSAIACLYIMPIVGLLIKKCSSLHFAPLEFLGKASYNIFLVQKVWYAIWRPIFQMDGNIIRRVGASYVVCIAAGVVFWLVESRITKRIIAYVCDRIGRYEKKEDGV